ncbi:PAS domain-containing sensor histidine kinase [Lacinutrix himadriensis]|uniref:PAS domain-containing sensor histidine kinase n=1 Tax=Lacinutrix himadriensis TaxID=641549 RepID=UPI0006E12E3F|nr:sensor histidine kinase [Lacinutrix himadriensis]
MKSTLTTAIIATNNDGIIYQFNEGAETLLGYSASEMIGFKKTTFFLLDEEFKQFKKDILSQYKNENSDVDPYQLLAQNDGYDAREWTIIKKDGTSFIANSILTPIKNENGESIGYLRIIRDITEQKKIESELLRKNQALNAAEKLTMVGNWQLDVITNDVIWSVNLYNIFGIDPKEILIYDTFFSYVHPDDKELVSISIEKSKKDKKFYDLLHRIQLKNGKIKTIQLLGEVILDKDGNLIEMMGTCQDVTEQRMAEIKFKGLLESAPDAMVIVNEYGEIQLINKQAENLFGYTPEELINKSVELLIPHRDNNEQNTNHKSFFEAPKTRKMGEGKDLYGINKQGKEIPIQISLSPLKTEEGLLVSTAIRDITVQKKIESDLLRKNQVLNAAEKITMTGNWQWDTVINNVKWSSNLFNIFEVDPKETLNFETYFGFVHPDDKETVSKSFEKSRTDKHFYDLLHRIISTSGKIKSIQLLGEVVTDDADNVIEIIGTCQDVTQQRMAEIKFKGLLESAPDAMVIVNEYGKIQLINKQAEKLFGYVSEELINKPVELLIPQKDNNKHITHRKSFFEAPKTRKMGEGRDLYGINKQGKEIPIQISLSPLKTEEGLLVSAAIRDITNQKKAEKKILEANESLEVLAQKLTLQNTQLADFVHITSHNLRAPVSNLNSLLEIYNLAETEDEKVLLFDKFEIVINHLTETLNTLIEALKTKNEESSNLENISFDDILNKTKEILTGQIIKTKAKITSDFSKKANITYNKVYLESIFLNLLSNALKYKSDDRNPEIFIHSEFENGVLKLKFKDNGLGINLKRHGHKLFGLNKVFHRHPDAKGVGLFMTKVQVEAMGGKITVESEVHVGSTFCINFNKQRIDNE